MLIGSHFSATAQQVDHEKTIDEFVISAEAHSLSFVNGINVTISKPKDDHDALTKGFQLCQTDTERRGGWKILAAKDVMIKSYEPLLSRAVLYEHQGKQHMVLYRPEKNGEYFFRIYPKSYD